MARTLAEIKLIHRRINQDILRLNLATNDQGLIPKDVRYFKEQKEKFNRLGLALKRPTWFEGYQDRIDYLIQEIKALLDSGRDHNSKEAKKRVLIFALLAAQKMLEHSLGYLTTQSATKQAEYLPDVLRLQKQIEIGLNDFFPGRPKVINLRLANLRNDYEDTYVKAYRGGFFGFFTLPIKRSFRKQSRDEELTFIEDIDKYLRRRSNLLSSSDKETIKLSALNLVRCKIQSEFFGASSLLSRLVGARLRDAGFADNNEIMEGFIEFCADRKIRVPEGLVDCYEEGWNLQP